MVLEEQWLKKKKQNLVGSMNLSIDSNCVLPLGKQLLNCWPNAECIISIQKWHHQKFLLDLVIAMFTVLMRQILLVAILIFKHVNVTCICPWWHPNLCTAHGKLCMPMNWCHTEQLLHIRAYFPFENLSLCILPLYTHMYVVKSQHTLIGPMLFPGGMSSTPRECAT